jgi:hypothetical protein
MEQELENASNDLSLHLKLDRIMAAGLLAVAVALVLTAAQIEKLSWQLWCSVYCFVISMPALSAHLLLTEVRIHRAKRGRDDWQSKAGLVAYAIGLMGIAFLLWHLSPILMVILMIGTVAAFFIVMSAVDECDQIVVGGDIQAQDVEA